MKLHVGYLSIIFSLSLIGSGPVLAQYVGGNAGGQSASTEAAKVQDWFGKYDNIRRQAQMSPQERARSDAMMSKGLSMFVAGDEKTEMQAFLRKLVQKNTAAADQLKQMPLYPETEKLHRGYYQYFTQAARVFNDYITVQNNPLAADAQGKSVAAGLLQGKSNLEMIDQNNKALDAQLRQQFNIALYHYP